MSNLICLECATEQGGECKRNYITMRLGICEYCMETKTVSSRGDYSFRKHPIVDADGHIEAEIHTEEDINDVGW